MLSLFLPIETPPPLHPSLVGVSPAPPAFYWIPQFFSLSALVTHDPGFDSIFVGLLASLAEEHVGAPANVAWTEDQVRTVFSIGLKNLDLPVGSGSTGRSTGAGGTAALFGSSGKKVESFAQFIVYTIYPVNGDSVSDLPVPATNTLQHLRDLLQAVENYFHPSNSGAWNRSLARLISKLASEFFKRFRDEASPECKTPAHLKLTREINREFVLILRPVTYLAMFGKDALAIYSAHLALKYLAWIEPSLIFPGLLDRIYPALETVNETHRTITCIGALWATCTPLFQRSHYPEGGQHLPQLLTLVLPGIDVNDPTKTAQTLMFIVHAAMAAPIWDLTRSGASGGGPEGREEADELCRLGTGVYEDWVMMFFDRVFAMFENLPQQHGNEVKKTVESSLIQQLLYTCEVVLNQLSPEIEDLAIKKIGDFARENVLPNATKAMGTLIMVAGHSSPAKKLAAFFPLACDRLLTELQNGAASDPTLGSSITTAHPFGFASMSDATFHWFQCMLIGAVDNTGAEILPYKERLLEVIAECVERCRSRRGYKWVGKLIKGVLGSLTRVYPKDERSFDKEKWNNREFMTRSYLHWAEPCDLDSINIDWHIPSPAELSLALTLIDTYVPLAIKNLRELVARRSATSPVSPSTSSATEQQIDRSDFARWLNYLRNMIAGMDALVPPESPAKDNEESAEADGDEEGGLGIGRRQRRPVTAGYCFTDPEDPSCKRIVALREEIGDCLGDLV
ncbi:hypothetical protein BDK51DRAFT_30739, partial [Blyttiomyces helicus]